ncbi:MAG: hypothetical protein DRI90_24370, partial [Deltaproteobacteria bacterium]
MAALTAGVDLPHKGNLDAYKIAVKAIGADTFYKGAIVYADAANGKAQVSVPAAGDVFLGICAETVVATAADDLVEIYTGGLWALNFATPAEGDVGDVCVMDIGGSPTDNIEDAETGADATLAADDILIGKILAIDTEETTRAWVQLRPGW